MPAPTWAADPVEGDYIASRSYYRILYDAYADRERAANGSRQSWEDAFGQDPVSDTYSYPAATNKVFLGVSQGPKFGGFGFLQHLWLRRDGFALADNARLGPFQFGNNAFGHAFVRKGFAINAADAFNGSGWNDAVLITAEYMQSVIGTIERKVPRIIASTSATQDQFGNAATAGQLAYGPSGGCRRVYLFDGSTWIKQPQSARPDRLSSSAGDIPPVSGAHHWHYQHGDYFGLHLFRQLRSAYKEIGVLMDISDPSSIIDAWSERSATYLEVNYGRFMNPDVAGVNNARYAAITGFANSGSTPSSFAGMVAQMNANWDVPGDFTVGISIIGVHAYSRSDKRTDGSDIAWDGNYDGIRGELKYQLARHTGCKVATYGFVAQSDFAAVPGVFQDYFEPHAAVFDDNGFGLTVNQWNTLLDTTAPADVTPTTLYESGAVYGKSEDGAYPVIVENGLDATPTARGFHIPAYVTLFNHLVPGGFTYQ